MSDEDKELDQLEPGLGEGEEEFDPDGTPIKKPDPLVDDGVDEEDEEEEDEVPLTDLL